MIRVGWLRLLAVLVLSLGISPLSAQDDPMSDPPQSSIENPAQVELTAEDALTGIDGLVDADARVSGNTITITGTADDTSVIVDAERAVIEATGADRKSVV